MVTRRVPTVSGELRIRQPREAAELPDDQGVEWAPLVPYWSVLWRSGIALAGELSACPLAGQRVVELGCGLAVPSLAAAQRGADVLATDHAPEALELVALNARENAVSVATAEVDWLAPRYLLDRARFDLVLAADVLYERASIGPLLSLLPRLGDDVWLADPDRPPARAFLEAAARDWRVETGARGVVRIHRLRKRQAPRLTATSP